MTDGELELRLESYYLELRATECNRDYSKAIKLAKEANPAYKRLLLRANCDTHALKPQDRPILNAWLDAQFLGASITQRHWRILTPEIGYGPAELRDDALAINDLQQMLEHNAGKYTQTKIQRHCERHKLAHIRYATNLIGTVLDSKDVFEETLLYKHLDHALIHGEYAQKPLTGIELLEFSLKGIDVDDFTY